MVGEFDAAAHLPGSFLGQQLPAKNPPRNQRKIFQFLQKFRIKHHGLGISKGSRKPAS